MNWSVNSTINSNKNMHQPRDNKQECKYVSKDQGADKSSARPTSRCILFECKNISFDASLVLYIHIYIYACIYSNNSPPIMMIERIYEHQNLLSL